MMKAITIAALLAGAATLAACGHKTETAEQTTTNTTVIENTVAPAPLSTGQVFANTAASSDAFEIATSELAATNAKSAAIKAFAKQMVTAHTGSTAKLKTAAAAASPAITPDPTLTPEQQRKLDSLKAVTGADFDKAYAAAQVEAHQATLDGLKKYSTEGDVPQLKAFATALIPTVTAHLNMAKGLKP